MTKILLATDFSDSSSNAFEYIKELVRIHPLQVDLLHVFDIPIPTATALTSNAVVGMVQERERAVNQHLREWQQELPEGCRGAIHAIHGTYPSTEIAEKAEKIGASLIVMALRQKYSFFERMIGTTTAHTIQKSTIPVLAIPNEIKFNKISSILFPTVMRVNEKLKEPEMKALKWLYDFGGMVDRPDIHMIHISKNLETVDTIIKDKPYPGMKFIVSGANTIEEGILNHLEKTSADLLAVYKPNRPFWERMYHSSVTRKLLFQSRIPLLVFS